MALRDTKLLTAVAIVVAALLALLFFLSGCSQAGMSADLLTCDIAEAVAVESLKALDAYDATVRADSLKRRADMLATLKRDLVKIGVAKLDPNQAEQVAEKELAAIDGHLSNFAEQERRRQALYETAVDNLNYMIEQAEAHRQFILYRADIEVQWKTYLQSQARARLAKMMGTTTQPAP